MTQQEITLVNVTKHMTEANWARLLKTHMTNNLRRQQDKIRTACYTDSKFKSQAEQNAQVRVLHLTTRIYEISQMNDVEFLRWYNLRMQADRAALEALRAN